MDPFLKSDVEGLLDEHQPPCVSIFLPLHPSGPGAEQDPLRAKRMLRRAEDLLEAYGLDPERAKRLLRPLRRQFASSRFFDEPADSLAAFCSADYCRTFFLPLELPEQLEVSESFDVKPLLALTAEAPAPAKAAGGKTRKRTAAAVVPDAARHFAKLAAGGRASNNVAPVLRAASPGRG